MASKKKLLQAAAGSAGGAGLDVDEVFSTFLYDGNSSTQAINNGIDLSGEGGLVWIKRRDGTLSHALFDTARGAGALLQSNLTAGHYTGGDDLTAFNSNGFTLGDGQFTSINFSSYDYASWTFRKAEKFFDVVTYTGNGVAGRTVSHNLGTTVGMLIIKGISNPSDWSVFHRSVGNDKYLAINETSSAQTDTTRFHSTTPSSTTFTLGSGNAVNGSGRTYVAYLFAHNDSGDGEFGPDSDQDIIKCDTYTGNGSSTGTVVPLGFEPQFIMLKKTNASQNANWYVFDTMRGIVTGRAGVGGDDPYLNWNATDAEVAGNVLEVTPTGFQLKTSSNGFNGSGDTYIYMAIRRGPLAAPDDATKVFALDDSSTTDNGGYTLNSNFPVDFYSFKSKGGGDSISVTRLTVGDLRFSTDGAEDDRSSIMDFDSNTGVTEHLSKAILTVLTTPSAAHPRFSMWLLTQGTQQQGVI